MIKNDRIVCIDLEATCWDDSSPKTSGKEVSEIIEMGYALVDVKTGHIDMNGSYIIKPLRSKISKFCTDLTGITQEQVDKGMRFDEACALIRKGLGTKMRTWASFGEYDRAMVVDQCKEMGVKYPFSYCHLNVKAWYGGVHGSINSKGLRQACEIEGLGWEGRHHSGMWDTYNLARLVSHLLLKTRHGLDTTKASSKFDSNKPAKGH